MTLWFSDEIKDKYEKLIVSDVSRYLPGAALSDIPKLEDNDLTGLINSASVFALADNHKKKTIAYEIATRVIELTQSHKGEFTIAAEFILTRLGNFPGRTLLRDRYLDGKGFRLPLYLKLEEIVKEEQNSVCIYNDEPLYLTDFQCDFLSLLAKSKTASISAPTSAGKSFVLSLDIVRRLKQNEPVSVVYTVPTRALIRQVMKEIIDALNKAGLKNIPVRCVPVPVDRENVALGAVYVFTPERLMSFLQTEEGTPWITHLFVDEAQTINDGARGVVLQSAIDNALNKFHDLRLYFASPLSKNPDYLPSLFMRRAEYGAPIENHSPVSQNIILASHIANKRKKVSFELITTDGRLLLGKRQLDISISPSSSSPYERKANFARTITDNTECTIIYVNGPDAAIQQAKAFISENHILPETEDVDVLDFINFIRNHVHQDYDLAKVLKHKVAFHYGSMPPVVRSRLEDLFSEGKLSFICCTSTLLQGVNLPAKNIIIENPTKGKGKNMKRGDFLNLAGRAGRLLQEFQGNVWCLNPAIWGEPCYEGEYLHEIKSAFSETLSDGGIVIQDVLKGENSPSNKDDLGIAALGKVFADYILSDKSLLDSVYATEENRSGLEKTEELCKEIKITLPEDIIKRNQGIHPQRLQDLFDYLDGAPDLTGFVSVHPYSCGADYVKSIFKLLNKVLGGVTNEQYKYFGAIAYKWMKGTPLKEIIETSILIQKMNGKFENATKTITDLVKTLDNDLRFRFVKYFRAYHDILIFILTEKGENEMLENMTSWHLFLECGASDWVVLSFISLGLSRTTALLVAKECINQSIKLPKEPTPEDCMSQLSVSWQALDLPVICRNEIKSLLHE